MTTPRRRRPWERPDLSITDEAVYLSRRRFLRALGLGGLAAGGLALGGRRLLDEALAQDERPRAPLPAPRNEAFADAGRPLTEEPLPYRYNNFYEFTTDKERVWRLARDFALDPWSLEVDGLVERPGTLSLEQVEALGLEATVAGAVSAAEASVLQRRSSARQVDSRSGIGGILTDQRAVFEIDLVDTSRREPDQPRQPLTLAAAMVECRLPWGVLVYGEPRIVVSQPGAAEADAELLRELRAAFAAAGVDATWPPSER